MSGPDAPHPAPAPSPDGPEAEAPITLDGLRPPPPSQAAGPAVVPLTTLLICCVAIAIVTGVVVAVLMRPAPIYIRSGETASRPSGTETFSASEPHGRASPSAERESGSGTPSEPAPTSSPPSPTASTSTGTTSPARKASPNQTTTPSPGVPGHPAATTRATPSPSAGASPTSTTAPSPTPTPEPTPEAENTAPPLPGWTPRPGEVEPRAEESNDIIVVVAAMDETSLTCVPWILVYNNSGVSYDVRTSDVELRDSRGNLCEFTGTQRPSTGTLGPHSCHYFYPAYYLNAGARVAEVVVRLQGRGPVTVPAQVKMTNLGPFDTLSVGMRARLEKMMADLDGFHWWKR